ncbi:MAG: 3-methylornithine--L-lysine ligase PylC [Thermodesulfobacteriota bacterium]
MKVAVIGGRLQGVEALYLASKAGWETLLVDKTADVPAAGLCRRFIALDVTSSTQMPKILEQIDLVIPALEDEAALAALARSAETVGVPLAYDPQAYALSSSKLKSNRLFTRVGLDVPVSWPSCGLPVIVKPDASSGSRGVRLINQRAELDALTGRGVPPETWVIQEFLPGPSYSLEVLGAAGRYWPLQVTDLFMDGLFDCKRVCAPSLLTPSRLIEFNDIAVRIAAALGLTGLMDLEVILNRDRLVLLEIDARLPSQTPTAVFWSTGLNMVAMLKDVFVDGRLPAAGTGTKPRAVIYEHVRVKPGFLEIGGEHLMSRAGPLTVRSGFFGADEALTDYRPGAGAWVATMIYCAGTAEAVWAKRRGALETLAREFNIETLIDPEAAGPKRVPPP